MSIYTRGGKRALDLLLTLPAMVVLAPVLASVALAIALTMGRPVLFAQTRTGLGGRPFLLRKFRTMRQAVGADGRELPDSERLTPLGQWLRRSSLDELPELWHVLRGEMSLVGPRPLLVPYLERYTPEQAKRHLVRPGLTGWSQVNGRSAQSWERKLALDSWYAENVGLWLDLRILAKTVWKVLRRADIGPEGAVSTPEFMGQTSQEVVGEGEQADER